MPYISQADRARLLFKNPKWAWPHPHGVGELNFVITTIVDEFLGSTPHYADYNAVVGVLECAKLELYRRLLGPYENLKMHEHGDVYV